MHKKQYELLPLEKKTRLMKTITEQRYKHLTEKEKKKSTWKKNHCISILLKLNAIIFLLN